MGRNPSSATCASLGKFLASLDFSFPIGTVGLMMLYVFHEIICLKPFEQCQAHGKLSRRANYLSVIIITLGITLSTLAHTSHSNLFPCWRFWWFCTSLCFCTWCFSAWMSLSLTYSFIHLTEFLLSSQLLTLETHLSQPFLASPTGFTTPVSKSIYFFCISVTNLRAGKKKKKVIFPTGFNCSESRS